jgi:hypothetical protein
MSHFFWQHVWFLFASLLKFVHGFYFFIYSQTNMPAAAFIPNLSLFCSVFEISFLNHAGWNIWLVNTQQAPYSFMKNFFLNSASEEFTIYRFFWTRKLIYLRLATLARPTAPSSMFLNSARAVREIPGTIWNISLLFFIRNSIKSYGCTLLL